MTRTYGLFLNMGANLGSSTEAVFRHTLEQARLAETLGYHDLWVTEHHCIPFGINPSALTASAFLLGRTERVRVGTAVVLAPLQHPLVIAEQSALLDQFRCGRFDLGLGRGGYVNDYELLELETARWDGEPTAAARAVVDYWTGNGPNTRDDAGRSRFEPTPLTRPHPPLFLATQTADAVRYAAENSLPLQHYFASPIDARVKLEQAYRQHNDHSIAHLHTLIVVVGKDEQRLRQQLAESLTVSFIGGDWPTVPQAPDRHLDESGKPLDRAAMAQFVAAGSIVGPIESVRDQVDQFVERTGAERLVLYMESIADAPATRQSAITFAEHMMD